VNSTRRSGLSAKAPATVVEGLLLALLVAGGALAEPWAAYRHDVARSGITADALDAPLTECWRFEPRFGPVPAWGDPKAEPVEGYLELRRSHFDDVFHAVADGESVYFGSSADHHVYCLDASTGEVRWTRVTDGPVRLAPRWPRDASTSAPTTEPPIASMRRTGPTFGSFGPRPRTGVSSETAK